MAFHKSKYSNLEQSCQRVYRISCLSLKIRQVLSWPGQLIEVLSLSLVSTFGQDQAEGREE